jgi:aryl-alcohol dehydrogenase-like predicted oxidoreductase
MEYVALGRTNVLVSRAGLAAGSMRLLSTTEQAALLRSAYDGGINYFDFCCGDPAVHFAAIAAAFHEVRQNVVLGAYVNAPSAGDIRRALETALSLLNTDYVDLLQIAGLDFVPAPGGNDNIVHTLTALKKEGKIRFTGLAAPFSFSPLSLPSSSIFDTLQFSFNMVNQEETMPAVAFCAKREIGCLASEPLCARFEEIADAFLFLRQFEHVVPLWEIRDEAQLRMLLQLVRDYEK